MIAQIALAAAILGLLGGIFYIVASSLLLAFAVGNAASLRSGDSSAEGVANREVRACVCVCAWECAC